MGVKTGASHLASLQDDRNVFIDGARVVDVTSHPAFANAVATIASLYDFQARADRVEKLTFEIAPGLRVNRSWQVPLSYESMVARRESMQSWAELHFGFMGRTPDHVASALIGQLIGIDVLREYDPIGARRLADYVRHAAESDHFVSYTIINPQSNRSASSSEQDDPHLIAGIVDEDSVGITVRGAKMLGTSTVMSNELFVANLQPLKPDEDRYAISFAIPVATPGLSLISRRSYEAAASSAFDNPLSSRFDENDVLVYFDDVKVPWERVFVHRNVAMARAQFHETPGHLYQNHQAQARLTVKLRFLAGVAHGIADAIGTLGIPSVAEDLGLLASQVSLVEAALDGMEVAGELGPGGFAPNSRYLYASQVATQELYGTVLNLLRKLAGGSLIMLPSSWRDLENPFLERIIARTQQSKNFSPVERVRFLKLAWDAIGSEFASRHAQYEMFYAGAQFVTRGHSFRTYDWAGARALVDQALELAADEPTPAGDALTAGRTER